MREESQRGLRSCAVRNPLQCHVEEDDLSPIVPTDDVPSTYPCTTSRAAPDRSTSSNIVRIHNEAFKAGWTKYKMAMASPFADLTCKEFEETYLMKPRHCAPANAQKFTKDSCRIHDLPQKFHVASYTSACRVAST